MIKVNDCTLSERTAAKEKPVSEPTNPAKLVKAPGLPTKTEFSFDERNSKKSYERSEVDDT